MNLPEHSKFRKVAKMAENKTNNKNFGNFLEQQ